MTSPWLLQTWRSSRLRSGQSMPAPTGRRPARRDQSCPAPLALQIGVGDGRTVPFAAARSGAPPQRALKRSRQNSPGSLPLRHSLRAFRSRGRPRRDDRSGPGVRPMPARSNNAADAAGLERLRLCIAGPKQSPTSRRETTEAVANQESQVVEKQQRDVAPSACAGRLAHHPGEAAVPPGATRLLSAWQTRSLMPDQSSSATAAISLARFGLRIVRGMQSSRRARRDF